MWVGVGRLVLDFYGNVSTKTKRKNLEDLCKDLKKRFNLSALEVAEFDDPEKCVIGFAAVMPESWDEPSAKSFVKKICKEVDDTSFARLTLDEWDVSAFGG